MRVEPVDLVGHEPARDEALQNVAVSMIRQKEQKKLSVANLGGDFSLCGGPLFALSFELGGGVARVVLDTM